jgi:hypothetical protein
MAGEQSADCPAAGWRRRRLGGNKSGTGKSLTIHENGKPGRSELQLFF